MQQEAGRPSRPPAITETAAAAAAARSRAVTNSFLLCTALSIRIYTHLRSYHTSGEESYTRNASSEFPRSPPEAQPRAAWGVRGPALVAGNARGALDPAAGALCRRSDLHLLTWDIHLSLGSWYSAVRVSKLPRAAMSSHGKPQIRCRHPQAPCTAHIAAEQRAAPPRAAPPRARITLLLCARTALHPNVLNTPSPPNSSDVHLQEPRPLQAPARRAGGRPRPPRPRRAARRRRRPRPVRLAG